MTITKYDASGNTFVIFHTNERKDYSKLAIELCKSENTDGLIVVLPHKTYDFEWLFYNNDGSTASMCGNGTRAVAHYAYTNKLCGKTVKFLTGAGVIHCSIDGNIIETTMTPAKIINENIQEYSKDWWYGDTGVPHLVTIVQDINEFNIELASKMRYKYNANVNFVSVENDLLKVRTYERGVEAETLACGTGITASFLMTNNLGLIPDQVEVIARSGEHLALRKDGETLYFKGKVKEEYRKKI